jgi:DNA-directed RNA polymerase subunit RPC12/RpoP
MAECFRFVCNNCSHAIEAWDDGKPYYLDKAGHKKYAYHPSRSFSRCIGNDTPSICLECGELFDVDSLNPEAKCHKCASTNIADTCKLESASCPYCHAGVFEQDQDFCCVS